MYAKQHDNDNENGYGKVTQEDPTYSGLSVSVPANPRMAKIFTRRGNSSSADRRVAAGVSQSIRVLLSARQG
jgi:hypothetical protein